jgi:hypothetical protein
LFWLVANVLDGLCMFVFVCNCCVQGAIYNNF